MAYNRYSSHTYTNWNRHNSYVGNLSIAEYVFSIPPGNPAIFQVRMLSIFSRGLGAVFALAGLATIALARNRLSLAKDAYRMAKVIQGRAEA